MQVGVQFVQLCVGLDLVVEQGGGASECGRDLIEGASACLGHLEISEDHEDQEEHGKDEEHVGATGVLRGQSKP